ncbi:hypothetical protein M514_28093 [Trichuris suis]|uniref:Uncharacterized protein n=1 Tax=Trichuris suis TaxID=68888 RepID=A0A085MR85_9BILA|nr:hypothetical protein M514_28093 [Trichuris suis]
MKTLKGFLPSHEDATEEELLQLQGERVNIEGDHKNEHLKSEAKAEKEMKRLRELLSIIDDAARVAQQHDLELERARRFIAALEDISSPYEELYNQKSRSCKQLYITPFNNSALRKTGCLVTGFGIFIIDLGFTALARFAVCL